MENLLLVEPTRNFPNHLLIRGWRYKDIDCFWHDRERIGVKEVGQDGLVDPKFRNTVYGTSPSISLGCAVWTIVKASRRGIPRRMPPASGNPAAGDLAWAAGAAPL